MKLHIIMHESFEAPAAFEIWAKERGHEIEFTKLYKGHNFPETTNSFDLLLVMGGPQCPSTTLAECSHFDAKKEIQFIKSSISADKIVLGVCLGAQLIGEALGAKFEHSPHREIGVFELSLTAAADQDPFFANLPKKFLVGHWHGDMPGLTNESQVLATSEGCPRQIVKYGSKIYGFQCHFEFTPEAIEGMIENCAHELTEHRSKPYIQNAEQLRQQDYTSINDRLFKFLDYIVTV